VTDTNTGTQISKLSRDRKPADKAHVLEALEEKSKIRPKPGVFRFSKPEVAWMTSMLDKHGEDFIGMAKDRKNVDQLTPRQIRAKISKFKRTTHQWAVYLKHRGLLPSAGEASGEEGQDDDAMEA
jgi:hypothetical protein